LSVKIRLKRMGSKKRPFYRIVATDSRNRRDGRFIETLGYYNPLTDPPDVKIDEELVLGWMRRGAVLTDNTESLLRRMGTMKKWSLMKQGVPAAELDARLQALKASETAPMSAEERAGKAQNKAEAKQADEEPAPPAADAAGEAAAEQPSE
jgi:small subunit ribosomal protein S16